VVKGGLQVDDQTRRSQVCDGPVSGSCPRDPSNHRQRRHGLISASAHMACARIGTSEQLDCKSTAEEQEKAKKTEFPANLHTEADNPYKEGEKGKGNKRMRGQLIH